MDLWKTIKGYFWWTYPRGSVHYDVMVTLILLFIFVTPLWVNFNDKPPERLAHPTDMLVRLEGERGFVCEIDASAVSGSGDTGRQLLQVIEPVTGGVTLDRFEQARAPGGRKIYRVWVHR